MRPRIEVGPLNTNVDYQPLLRVMSVRLRSSAMERFDSLHDPDGVPWQPLKHPRPGSKGSDRPLNDFGILRSSMTVAGSRGSINEIGPRFLRQGTNIDYGPTHQEGRVIRPRKAKLLAIPATREAQRIGSPRNWPDGQLIFRFSKGGGVAVTKKGTAEIVQYYFAKQVVIPARPFSGISDAEADDLSEMTGEYVRQEMLKK